MGDGYISFALLGTDGEPAQGGKEMRIRTLAGVAVIALSGCGVPSMIEGDVELLNRTGGGDFKVVAACAYEKFEPEWGSKLKKIDLVDRIHIDLPMDGGVFGMRFWRFSFYDAGTGLTRIENKGLRQPDTFGIREKRFALVTGCLSEQAAPVRSTAPRRPRQ